MKAAKPSSAREAAQSVGLAALPVERLLQHGVQGIVGEAGQVPHLMEKGVGQLAVGVQGFIEQPVEPFEAVAHAEGEAEGAQPHGW